MALDRETAFANAERLLKQGRIKPALDEYRRIAEDAPRDVLTWNRIGDVLARAGRSEDAIGYYEKAGEHFAQAGFYPRAIAILKKIVKLDPARLDVVVRLGDLNAKQKLGGEARQYYLQAAEFHLRARQFRQAREVYERLVEADPADLTNRVRLAEARAAEGDSARAGEDLLGIAASMIAGERLDDAERTFRRAGELIPERPEPVAGIAACLVRKQLGDDAVGTIDAAIARRPADARLLGEKLILLTVLGRTGALDALLAEPGAEVLHDEEIVRAFAEARARGADAAMLARFEALFERWRACGRGARVAALLDRLALAVDGGWLAALERLRAVRVEEGAAAPVLVRLLERLVSACEAHDEPARAAQVRLEIASMDTSPAAARRRAAQEHVGTDAGPATGAAGVPAADDVPAVPLTPQDEEIVTGHLTEAEVFLKYGLQNEALQQLREAVRRFPGHVRAAERLIDQLRTRSDREELRDALVVLALARRAAGDHAGAREAAEDAVAVAPVPPAKLAALSKLGLVEAPRVAAAAPRPAAPDPPAAAPKAAAPAPKKPAPAPDDDLVIDFDDDVEPAAAIPSPAPAPAAAGRAAAPRGHPARVASPDMIDEIAFYLEQGMSEDARKKIAALRVLGFSGADLDALEQRAAGAPAAPQEESFEELSLDESDLSSITATLEAELGDTPLAAATPAPEVEQSIDEVFDDFKRHVNEEVGAEDYRTHYDLGIAYKEMGLVDDAIEEFRVAAQAPELFRDACSMLAMCHRARGDFAEAALWYRRTLAAPGEGNEPLTGIRYDLAEVLFEQGDYKGALDLFQQVMRVDPSYREVRRQVSDLEARLRT